VVGDGFRKESSEFLPPQLIVGKCFNWSSFLKGDFFRFEVGGVHFGCGVSYTKAACFDHTGIPPGLMLVLWLCGVHRIDLLCCRPSNSEQHEEQ
jgi:hypothetical protein